MSDLMSRFLAGAAAGCAATGPMTLFLAAAQRALPPGQRYPMPPRRVTMNAAAAAGVAAELSEPEKKALTAVAHTGFGTAAGAVYGALAPHLPLPPVASGVAYALAVWAGSYLGWLPAAGLYPPPDREPAERQAMMVGAHVVWGAVLGLLVGDQRR